MPKCLGACYGFTMKNGVFGALALCSLVACSGDPPVSGGGSSSSGGSGLDGGQTGNDGGVVDAAGADGSITCKAPLVACGPVCVEVVTSGDNCGRCGHSCGGAKCSDGICQPQVIRAGLPANINVAVGKGGVFFTHGLSVETCPLTGCVVAPVKVATFVNYEPGPPIAVGEDAVLFRGAPDQNTIRPNAYHCPVSGVCTLKSIDADGFGDISSIAAFKSEAYTWTSRALNHHSGCDKTGCASKEALLTIGSPGSERLFVDATGAYYIDAAGALHGCPVSGACTPSTIATGLGTALGMQSAGGKLYVALPGDGANRGSIRVCNATSCEAAAFSNRPLGNVSSFAVDARGVYWFTDGTDLRACPIAGCGAAIGTVLSTPSPASSTLVDTRDGFLYYVTRDASGATILRVATP